MTKGHNEVSGTLKGFEYFEDYEPWRGTISGYKKNVDGSITLTIGHEDNRPDWVIDLIEGE